MSDRTQDQQGTTPSLVSRPKTYDVLLYGDVNLGILDGSAIWLVSIAETLARVDINVHVLLKAIPESDRLLKRLTKIDNIELHQPFATQESADSLSYDDLQQRLDELNRQINPHAILVRGRNACAAAIHVEGVAAKLWSYVTDLPHPVETVKSADLSTLTDIANNSRRMFAQTPDAQAYLEAIVPAAAGKTVLLNPMIPDEFFIALNSDSTSDENTHPIELIYSGKFKPEWRTYEMCNLPASGHSFGLDLRLTMLGDKFQSPSHDRSWEHRMRDALTNTGVRWLGGVAREESIHEIQRAHIGLSWRDESLDESLELSTKVLEYAAAGTPPLLNRTPVHERLFGKDYPLFVENDSSESVLKTLHDNQARVSEIRKTAQDAVRQFSVSNTAARLRRLLDRAYQEPDLAPSSPTRVLIAGHDLKFVAELSDSFETSSNISLEFDEWTTLHNHDHKDSLEKLARADIIFCEWAGKNAVWYSKNKKPKQKLFIRLHGFEVRASWLQDIKIDHVTGIIVVSAHMKQRILEKVNWPASKIHVIANSIDTYDLNREKLEGYQRRIGLVGIVPFLKRPDRALKLVSQLRERNEDYTLHIRGRLPWEYPHVWKNAKVQEQYLDFFDAIGSNPDLSRRIIFEPFGADMSSWYRKIGFILSPSDDESFHLAPAEAMVSGTIPIVWNRQGSQDIFGAEFIVNNSIEAAELIVRLSNSDDLLDNYQSLAANRSKSWDASIVNRKIFKLLFQD